jgi:hypothetical protein
MQGSVQYMADLRKKLTSPPKQGSVSKGKQGKLNKENRSNKKNTIVLLVKIVLIIRYNAPRAG